MIELVRDIRVVNVLAKFENDPWKIMDVRVLTGLVCPAARPLGVRQYPGALKGCGVKIPQKDRVQSSECQKRGSKRRHIYITQHRGSTLPGLQSCTKPSTCFKIWLVDCVNSLRFTFCKFNYQIPLFHWKCFLSKFHRIAFLAKIHHWFRWCIAVIGQQAIIWTNVDEDQRCQALSLGHDELTLKYRETHGCVVSTVATDGLVLKHQAISIHNAD